MMIRILLDSILETLIGGNVLKLVTGVVSCTVNMGDVDGVAKSWPLVVSVHLDELVGRVPGTEFKQSNLAAAVIINYYS